MRNGWLGVLAIALTVSAACSGSDGKADGTESSYMPSWESSTPASVPELSTNDEAAYKQALRRWKKFGRQLRPIWAVGQATESSAAFYRKYFHDWQAQQAQLQQLEKSAITFSGSQTVSWYRPGEVNPNAVSIEACVTKEATAFRDGAELPPAGPEPPYFLTIYLSRTGPGSPYRIDRTVPQPGRECD